MRHKQMAVFGLLAGLLASQLVLSGETRTLARAVLRDKILGG